MNKPALVKWIDDLLTASEGFISDTDFYVLKMTKEEWDLDGFELRTWQTRLARLMQDLNTLRRRLDE